MIATTEAYGGSRSREIAEQATGWLQDNVLSSPLKFAINLALAWLAYVIFAGSFKAAPILAAAVGGLWLLGLVVVVFSAWTRRYLPTSRWLQDHLYNSAVSALTTLAILLLLAGLLRGLYDWAIANASFSADPAAAATPHTGATWGVIIANFKLFMVGQLAAKELWRVGASIGLLAALAVVSVTVYGPFSARLKPFRRMVTWLWLLSPLALYALLRGLGEAGPLHIIDSRTWGGLLFTLIISVFAIVVSFPIGVLLALGRRSSVQGVPAWLTYSAAGLIAVWGFVAYTVPNLPLSRTPLEYVFILWPLWLLAAAFGFQRFFGGNVVAAFSTIYIEFVRGVPLITVLFMANIMLPLFLPSNVIIENAFRAMWGFMLFSAAYLAENVRGGLQSIPKGQYEAAQSLGLNTFQQYRFIVLPQALRVVIPPIVGQFIGLFKDTSLVAIVGLFDLLNIANAVVAQPDWLGLRREAYAFVFVVYYIGSAAMAAASRWLERRLGVGER